MSDTPGVIGWIFHPENKGKRVTQYDCFYCGLRSQDVEAGGMWYCPDPRCTGPGSAWFRSTLDSYCEESGGRHSVDQEEWDRAARKYLTKLGFRDKEIYGP